MKKISFLSFFLLLVIIQACKKDLTLTQPPYDSKLSIECLITPNTYPIAYINNTLPYLNGVGTNDSFFARNAIVTITSSLGTINFTADSTFNYFLCDYIYFYKGDALIVPNTTYTLNVSYNSKAYTATCKTDQPIVQLSSVSYVQKFKDVYGEHEGVVLNYDDPASLGQYYRYEMHRFADSSAYRTNGGKVPCLNGLTIYTKEIGRSIYSDLNSNGIASTVTFEPAYKHKLGDATYVMMHVMDKNAFDYYDQLDRQKLAQFNPFVEPVFLKPTQFVDAFGCFGAYSVSDSVSFVYPE
jgi:Domain of unknown function (DUF4249)